MVNEVDPVPPAGTVAEWEVPPLTLQLPGTPLRVTVWLPAARPETVTPPVSEGQVMVNDVDAVPPAETVTVRDVPLFTEQLLGTLLRTTVWLAGERLENVTLSVGPIDRLVLPSRVTVYPAGWSGPD